MDKDPDIQVLCDCGNHMVTIKQWDKDFDSYDLDFWDTYDRMTFWERLKAVFNILTGGSYLSFNMVMTKADLMKLAGDIVDVYGKEDK